MLVLSTSFSPQDGNICAVRLVRLTGGAALLIVVFVPLFFSSRSSPLFVSGILDAVVAVLIAAGL
jgi:hypothetical protein